MHVCQSPVVLVCSFHFVVFIFQHIVYRERDATGWKGLTNATSKDVWRGAQNTRQQNGVVNSLVTAWKRKKICSPLSGGSFFLYACLIPFSCQGPLRVFTNLIVFFSFFLIQFNFFLFVYLFVPYKLYRGNFFGRGETHYIYGSLSKNRRNLGAEERPIIYTMAIQWIGGWRETYHIYKSHSTNRGMTRDLLYIQNLFNK